MTEKPEQPKQIPRTAQDEKGRFKPGNPGGLGRRGKRSPLHRAITDERAEQLWNDRLEVAQSEPQLRGSEESGTWLDYSRRDAAAEFILRHKNGSPPQATPDIPPLAWPPVMSVDDLAAAVGAVLAAHGEGQIDGAGLKFLVSIVVDLAKVFEVSDLGPKLRKLEEHVAAIGGGA